MRTPLSAIIGMTELAEKHPEDTKQVEGYLKRIGASSRQLLGLINDILEISQVRKGKITIEHNEFDLKTAVGDYTAPFVIQAEREEKNFTASFHLKNRKVKGDSFRLGQVMNNLLSNAFKFTKSGDSIAVSVEQMEEQSGDVFRIIISDTGAGMSEEFLTRLFLPYERETRFGAKYVAGTGLGMAIVKSIVSQMDGQISVDSKLGEGSVFTLMIPFEVLPDSVPEEEDALECSEKGRDHTKTEYTNLAGLRILLAEDNEINMEICCEMLGMAGIEVTQAWNGREALEVFRSSPVSYFDAVLMDMQMPEMDGCEAASAIRNLKHERADAETVPIIAITANAFSEDIEATEKAGMNAHISKPINFPVLCRTLDRMTGNKKNR